MTTSRKLFAMAGVAAAPIIAAHAATEPLAAPVVAHVHVAADLYMWGRPTVSYASREG